MPVRHASPIRAFLTFVCFLALSPVALGQERPNAQIGRAQSAVGRNGMVVAQEALAARIGVDILKRGGNAVDAAVAVGFAMAVTYPRAGNLGGGGFMVIHRRNGRNIAIDYRETAPRAINDKSFLDAQGNADPQKSRILRARHRRAGHRRGSCARRAEIRLRPLHTRRVDRAGDCACSRRLSGHRRDD